MNRSEFGQSLADEYDLDTKQSKLLVSMVLEHLRECILDNDRVSLGDFGVFSTRYKGPRVIANNLKLEGESDRKMSRPRLVLKFRPSKKFKELLIREGEALMGDEEDDLEMETDDAD